MAKLKEIRVVIIRIKAMLFIIITSLQVWNWRIPFRKTTPEKLL